MAIEKRFKIGCCGFPIAKERYFKNFNLVEIQQTFYKIPSKALLKKWHQAAPKDFEFTVKCFQGVTHPITSRTWLRAGKITGKKANYGNLQPTKEVFAAWQDTLEAAKILNSKIILIQLPASFIDSKTNQANAEKFFKRALKNKEIKIAFEPRGWQAKAIKKFCQKFNLIHCVDPFVAMPEFIGDIAYFRLHGKYINKRIIYNYRYTLAELKNLKSKLEKIKAKEIYVLFNNLYMWQNAMEFKNLFSNF